MRGRRPAQTRPACAAEGDLPKNLGAVLQTFAGHSGAVNAVAFSKDGKYLATGGRDRTVRLWDLGSGNNVRIFQGHFDHVNGVAFHPAGRQLASVGQDQTVRFWPLESVENHRELTGHQGFVWSAAFRPDGLRIASGTPDRTVKIWDAAANKLLRSIQRTRPR